MIRVAIVEDDDLFVSQVNEYLNRYGEENGVSFSTEIFHDGDAVVTDYKANYDIILMDIELPLLNGMDAASEIRQIDKDVEIIFITNSPHYAIQGYRVGALDYILKPINFYAFSETLTRAIERRNHKADHYLIVNIKGGKQRLAVKDIRFVEVMDHDLTFHTIGGEISAKGTIKEVVDKLSDYGFFHCNKGYLINLTYVDAFVGQDVRIGNDVISVGRNRKKAFIDALNSYASRFDA